jgi:hypothetical protein
MRPTYWSEANTPRKRRNKSFYTTARDFATSIHEEIAFYQDEVNFGGAGVESV